MMTDAPDQFIITRKISVGPDNKSPRHVSKVMENKYRETRMCQTARKVSEQVSVRQESVRVAKSQIR